MTYRKATQLHGGDEIILKRSNIPFSVMYVNTAISDNSNKKNCWVHVSEYDEEGINIFHHTEIR